MHFSNALDALKKCLTHYLHLTSSLTRTKDIKDDNCDRFYAPCGNICTHATYAASGVCAPTPPCLQRLTVPLDMPVHTPVGLKTQQESTE